MKKRIVYTFILFLLIFPLFADTLNLMPYPQKIKMGAEKYYITTTFKINIKGPYSRRVFYNKDEFLKFLSYKTGFLVKEGDSKLTRLDIFYEKAVKLSPKMDESYKLVIDKDGIKLKAKTDIGIVRGIFTLYQLFSMDSVGFYFPYVKIDDWPRFSWRGLLIDTSRHFMPVDMILRNLKGMALVKMNVLHFHLSDDQGFRLECKKFPKLYQKASDGLYYTQKEMKKIIEYADLLGIRVVPEFDIPGHTYSWIVAYPELASLPGNYKMRRDYGVFNPVLDPSNKKVYKFLKKFFKEMAKLFPDEYIHIGGDEVNGVQWKKSERIKKFMKKHKIKTLEELQVYFNRKVLKILKKYHKKMIGWDEIYGPGLPKDVVIHSWRGKKALVKGAKEGYYTILSNGYYIDLLQPTSYHYTNDPIPESANLTEEEKARILGGDATMWAELVNNNIVDSRIWPRTAAIAERLWSSSHMKDLAFMYNRLWKVSLLLENVGTLHIKNQEALLRNLINSEDVKFLKEFLGYIEPIMVYKRHWYTKYNVFWPLTRTVDGAIPDPETSVNFKFLVQQFLKEGKKEDLEKIKAELSHIIDISKKMKMKAVQYATIKELLPLTDNLIKTSKMALTSLEYAENGKEFSPELDRKRDEVFTEASKQVAELRIAIYSALKDLAFYNERDKELAVIETNMGKMIMRFYEKEAPLHVAQFKELIKKGFYNGKTFYRVVKGHVIQAGDGEGTNYKTIKAEFNFHKHLVGTVGMARDRNPDSGSTEFYICLVPRPHLDGKYTVFGQLIEGYDVLENIGNVEVKKQFLDKEKKIAFHTPVKPVVIKKAYLIKGNFLPIFEIYKDNIKQ